MRVKKDAHTYIHRHTHIHMYRKSDHDKWQGFDSAWESSKCTLYPRIFTNPDILCISLRWPQSMPIWQVQVWSGL